MEERIRAGMGLMYQHPPKIRGVKLRQIAEYLTRDKKKIDDVARELSLEEHLDRDINLGFSGGEMKRAELFQLILQDPDLLLLDEPESGVDIENISLMGRTLRHFIEKEGKSLLVITHTGYILDHIRAAGACVLMDGVIWCDGSSPKEVFRSIQEEGYEKCKVCTERKKS
jgi:Fe-S cluster assembly ATP-binding protein